MSAAQHADILFVKDKKDNDLGKYCDKKGFPYKLFKDWNEIKGIVSDIIEGKVEPKEAMTDNGLATKKEEEYKKQSSH